MCCPNHCIDTLPPPSSALKLSQHSLCHTPTFLPLSYLIFTTSLFRTPSSFPLLPVCISLSSRNSKMRVTKSIHDFLQLLNKNFIASAKSGVAAQLLRGGIPARSFSKFPIPCTKCNSFNVLTKIHCGAGLQNLDLIIWDAIVICPHYVIDAF